VPPDALLPPDNEPLGIEKGAPTMKRILTAALATAGVAVAVFSATAFGQAAPPSWPPGGPAQVFIWSDTVTADTGKQENFFSRLSTVVFRAYAVDLKTKAVVTPVQARYFYVKIPGQPNVKMTYGPTAPGSKKYIWTGKWTIPTDYPLGVVNFAVLVHTKARHHGVFMQVPVDASRLTVTPGI
jgi:hypothetical protein